MTQANRARTSGSLAWFVLLSLLVACRVPSVVQPAGGDQLLYSYVADRILDGAVPYRDAFEQKPPGVFAVYAVMWGFLPHESAVAVADLVAASSVAWLLWSLGSRMFGGAAGGVAAALFLVVGDPGIQRLAGMNVRAQCETFMALAVTAAVAAAWSARDSTRRLLLAGALCGLAVWLKYNAIVYIAPVAAAAGLLDLESPLASRVRSLVWICAGGASVVATGLLYFAAGGALGDLWAGTIAYNLAYSAETYRSALHMVEYPATLLFHRARIDGLWFLGGLGLAGLLLARARFARAHVVAFAWTGACILSIAINGARGLPQYFVQAQPALALAAAAGLALVWRGRRDSPGGRLVATAAALLIVAGAWRVGIEPTTQFQPRLFGVPQALENLAFDARFMSGRISRGQYLARFDRGEAGKFSPAAVERLATYVSQHTPEAMPTFVFGFASGGVYVKSNRPSASRFFWSRPVVIEFERGRPGYGSDGLLADLTRARPEVIALQKHDWGLAEDVKDSFDFFMTTPHLREWLDAGYTPAYEDAVFSVWRRRQG